MNIKWKRGNNFKGREEGQGRTWLMRPVECSVLRRISSSSGKGMEEYLEEEEEEEEGVD